MGSKKTQAEKSEAIKQAEEMLKKYEKERKEHCTPCTCDDKTNLTVVGAKQIPNERGYQVEITNASKIGLIQENRSNQTVIHAKGGKGIGIEK